ncbi:MAG: hypothetical protein ACOX7D_02255 [Alphaproteobacteria bacterium]|jgi:hypothetical protein|nr:hypothetical protein [Alphaproteobacteria bacterium]
MESEKIILSRELFFKLEKQLFDSGLDSDFENFSIIKERLVNKQKLSENDFARHAIYVILAGGFSQKTAKKIHAQIMDYLIKNSELKFDELFGTFHNKNKIKAIIKIWVNRQKYRNFYYNLNSIEEKLSYLSTLPHIGKITANHLARNLGENVVKYDIWIQRLGVAFSGMNLHNKIDNTKLDQDVKKACDTMFKYLEVETGLPRGYIDVVLWKSCQNGLIKL